MTYTRNLHDGPHYGPCYSLLRVLTRLLNPYAAPQKRQIAETAPADLRRNGGRPETACNWKGRRPECCLFRFWRNNPMSVLFGKRVFLI